MLSTYLVLSALAFVFVAADGCTTPYTPICNVVETNSPGPLGQRVCNAIGTLMKPQVLQSACTSIDVADCRDSCVSDSLCRSFSFEDANTGTGPTCTLYSRTLSQQGFRKNTSSTATYFNRFCFTYQACSTPAPSNFTLQIKPGSGSPVDGKYAVFTTNDTNDKPQFNLTSSSGAATFFLNSQKQLISYQNDPNSEIANTLGGGLSELVFNTPRYLLDSATLGFPLPIANCRLYNPSPDYLLSCRAGGSAPFYTNRDGILGVGPSIKVIKMEHFYPINVVAAAA